MSKSARPPLLRSAGRADGRAVPVAQVGHEFSSVEALWSQFENVMAKEPEDGKREGGGGAEAEAAGDERAAKAEGT